MGIRFYCPNGHRLNVKPFQAGRRGICPYCGASVQIPTKSTRRRSKSRKTTSRPSTQSARSGGQGLEDRVAGGAEAERGTDSAASRARGGSTPAGPGEQTPVAADRRGADLTRRDFPTAIGQAAGQPPPVPTTAGDPLAEAPEAVWYVRPASGGQYGPATAETMRSWIGEGRVRGDALVWREGWRDWRQASATFLQLEADDEISALAGAVADGDSSGSGLRGKHRAPSRRSKTSSKLLIAGLTLLVVVLSIMLIWVLGGW